MARRTNQPETLDNDDTDTDTRAAGVPVSYHVTNPPNLDSDDEPALDVVERLRLELQGEGGDRSKVKVYRIPERGDRELCRDYSGQEIADGGTDVIRHEWGPGVYELVIYGSKGIAARSRIRFAAPLVTLPAPGSSSGNGGDLASALRALVEMQGQTLRAIQTMQPQQAPQSRAEMLAEMAALKNLFTPAAPASADPMAMFSSVLGVFREMKGAAQEIVGDATPEPADPLAASLPKLIDLAGKLMPAGGLQGAAPAAPPVTMSEGVPLVQLPPATAAAVAPSHPAPAAPTDEDDDTVIVRGLIAQLVKMARTGASVENGGEFIADNLPDDLLNLMDHPQWWDFVVQAFPQLAPHETWMKAAKAHADKLLTEEPDAGSAG
jgi:hypothetical protein